MISLHDVFYSTFKDLRKNKARSMLTTLGIIIGVSSVILIASLSSSAGEVVKSKIYTYGTNGVRFYGYDVQFATVSDVEKIRQNFPEIQYITPFFDTNYTMMEYNGINPGKIRIQATNNDYYIIKGMGLSRGRFFSNSELISGARVCIIGETIRQMLFGGVDPVDQVISLGDYPLRIVGVMEGSGSSLAGKDFDKFVAIPYGAIQVSYKGKKIDKNRVEQIYMSTYKKEQVEIVKRGVSEYFREKFNLRIAGDDRKDYDVDSSEDRLATASYISKAMTLLLVAVASIALFVGGVGIMNIMLASVNERIREIGIRMAIGAKSRDILVQFLAESITLSVLGGFVGIVIGVFLYALIVQILKWPFIFSPFSVFVSFFFAFAVGVAFGFYPAKKASSMKPIEALRHV